MDTQALIANAMLQSLDQEARDALITKAIAYILAPQPRGGFSSTTAPSPLEEAFHTAVRGMAEKLVAEYVVNTPSVRERLLTEVEGAFDKFFTGEKLVQVLTERMYSLFESTR